MDCLTFNQMIKGMRMLKARQRLILMDAAQYPYIAKASEKNAIHRNAYKEAYPESFEKRVVKNDDLRLV